MAGRVSAFAVSPVTEQTLYLGTASGGLWKSTDGGGAWTSIFDAIGTQTIGSLALDPNNSDTLWVGTGEQRQSCLSYFGMGLFRSTDGGASFSAMNGSGSSALDLSWVTAVAVQPGDSNLVLAGGPGFCIGGASTGGGLYRSTDGGASWSKVLNGQANDILFVPGSPSTVYAAMGTGTSDANAGVFRSTNAGSSWRRMSSYTANPPFYYHELIPDPREVQRIFSIDVVLQVSADSGKSFSGLNSRRVHVDYHALWVDPSDTRHLITGNDGGLYESYDRGATWRYAGNLPVTQFYKVAVDNARPFYNVYGGTQDNNTIGGPSRA